MTRIGAFLIGVLLAVPASAQAEDFGLIWLQNCLAVAETSQNAQSDFGACATNVFYVCQFATEPEACAGKAIDWMDEKGTRYLSMAPMEFGETDIARHFYAQRRALVVAGPDGSQRCMEQYELFPGCEGLAVAIRFQFARGLLRQIEDE